jgi:hypothetical protein
MARCKNCGEKFEVKTFLQKFCRMNDECLDAESKFALEKLQKQKKKDWNKYKQERRPFTHKKENKAELQRQINLLARKIDQACEIFTCIDCGNRFGKQVDAGHFHSVGSNATIRWNLHNIHSQASNCNRNGQGGGKQHDYYKGLVEKYGSKYAEYVDIVLPLKYKYIGLTEVEIYEKLKLVRKINRTFDTYEINDPIKARKMFNKIIGIYV